MHHPAYGTDENGDSFDQWLVRRSFALLHPVCRMGMWVVLPLLLLADPVFHVWQLWPSAIPHHYLALFHLTTLAFLGSMWLATRGPDPVLSRTHNLRLRGLTIFFVLAALLCVWFGIVSWLGFGDLSVVALTNVMLATAFLFPGAWRRVVYGVQAILMATGIIVLDKTGNFLGQLQCINLLVILIVVLAIDRYMMHNAQDLFEQKCVAARAKERADEVLFNALPPDIARELEAHNQVQPRLHPGMTVLFADLVGFTAFAASRPPGDVVQFLNRLFSLFDAQLEVHGVEKIKTMGDAYMAVHATDPGAVAHFALALAPCLAQVNRELGQHLQLRVGMHCGPTVAGVIGAKCFLYDVWGDAVNLASRMESSSLPGRIQVTAALQRCLQDRFVLGYRGLLPIEGCGPMHTYFLLGRLPQAC